MRDSLLPLFIVLMPQIALSALQLGVPVLAPAFVTGIGMPPEAVGLIGGLMGFGSVWLFAANQAVTPVLGPLRALIAACALAVTGVALMLTGIWAAVFAGAVCIGFAYAVTAPAGSQILSRHTPRRLWGTLFSIRQSGVPVGGAIAGLVGAGLAAAVDWRAGLAAIAALSLICACLLAAAPAQFRGGASGAPFRVTALFDPANAIRPFLTLRRLPQLIPVSLASMGFAVGQGSTFSFLTTYLTDGLGLTLTLAGAIYSAMQLASFAGRVIVGVIADRLGSTRLMMIAMAIASSGSAILLAQFSPEWPRALLFAGAGLIGLSVATWNGLFLAEIAKLVPPEMVGEATASATFFTFLAYMVAPPLFGAMVWFVGYSAAYYCVAAAVLGAGVALWAGSRADRTE
ncbi:MAG TPA: MFS transporter [Thermohalobaculum sp.]|nr:MFS transporter [Thermohalobaculum sp.]